MATKAFYGVEAQSYADHDLEDFHQLLAVKIMYSPKRWGLVKYVYRDLEETERTDHCKRFVIVFNSIISQDELDEFLEPFGEMELTSFYGLEL